MNRTLIALLLASAAFVGPAAAGQRAAAKLPATYRTWLEDEVPYIIAPVEREVFLKLGSDRERDLFIEAFWKQRDPTPGTPENEFKTEHARRLAHADRYLGRDAPRPGRRTDRGRIYIILGEPGDTQSFVGKSSIYDTEVWFYQGKTDLGLPAGFYVMFFREGGRGEYRLYSPVANGPQALLAGYFGGSDYGAAYEKLRDVEPSLAPISLSRPRRDRQPLRTAVDVLRYPPSAHRVGPCPRRGGPVRPEVPSIQGPRRSRVHGQLPG